MWRLTEDVCMDFTFHNQVVHGTVQNGDNLPHTPVEGSRGQTYIQHDKLSLECWAIQCSGEILILNPRLLSGK